MQKFDIFDGKRLKAVLGWYMGNSHNRPIVDIAIVKLVALYRSAKCF